jgi:membrane protein implicated in regulation of membrane protease activity
MNVYLAALVLGALFVGASVLKGGKDTGSDQGDDVAHGGPFGLFLSLRFWSFALAFFGLTGTALAGLELAPAVIVAVVASVVGLTCGGVAARVLQHESRKVVGAVAAAEHHVGREGRLLLPLEPGGRAKLRVRAPDGDTDLVAELAPGQTEPLAVGERVWIVEMRGTTAHVAPSPQDLEQL